MFWHSTLQYIDSDNYYVANIEDWIDYIEDITRWREDMNFIFEWQNNILRMSAASE